MEAEANCDGSQYLCIQNPKPELNVDPNWNSQSQPKAPFQVRQLTHRLHLNATILPRKPIFDTLGLLIEGRLFSEGFRSEARPQKADIPSVAFSTHGGDPHSAFRLKPQRLTSSLRLTSPKV